VLPGIDLQAGQEVAERLREAVEQARPTDIPITISLGVSAASGAQVDYDTLFKAADEALYAAKRAGRNRVSAAPAPRPGLGDAAAEVPRGEVSRGEVPRGEAGEILAPQLVG
jgi:pantoate kinase